MAKERTPEAKNLEKEEKRRHLGRQPSFQEEKDRGRNREPKTVGLQWGVDNRKGILKEGKEFTRESKKKRKTHPKSKRQRREKLTS